MLRVVCAHNFYRSEVPSGENQVVIGEQRLLRKCGHDVFEYRTISDALVARGIAGAIYAASITPWNPWVAQSIRRKVDELKPDIVHIHNTFPLLSPSIFHAIGHRAARVLTLHNYRIYCPAAIPMRNGTVCTECLDKRSPLPSILHGCYRQSRAATLPLAINVGLHRFLGTWTSEVDAFICLSDFQRELMVRAGLPRDKVHVKPNFHPGSPDVLPWHERNPYAVFVGRLSEEKGVVNLLRAWQAWGANAPELRVVGDGPLRAELERMSSGLPVRFLGQLPAEQAQAEIARARLQILPSECYETFGLVVVEAFAHGTPAAVSDLGPLPSIVAHGRSGIVFQPANPQSLLGEVRTAWETPGLLETLGKGARAEFDSKYTEEANYTMLMNIYEQAIEVSRNG